MSSEQESSSEELGQETVAETQSVGERLRAAREEKGLDLPHIAAETRIPERHLETIERGAFNDLPSRTYAIGFARSYARIVGLNEAEIAAAVRQELSEGVSRKSALAGGMEPGDPAKLPSAGLAWFGAFAALILAIGIYAFYSTYFGAGDGLDSLVAQADEETAQVAENGASEADGAPSEVPVDAASEVVFTALEDGIWVRFYEEDGERLFEKQMENGEQFVLPATAVEPRINTGRPDALAITIGGQPVAKLAEEPITLGDTAISAAALLARADIPDPAASAAN
ncbi:DUF4115 domain-containing protein [Erythrobacter insulae]|uniref:DUF4115 domain-containing protein n=1 Tax=Erythrobacter insulae TaxID=2584124 RepID=A0A547P9M1_9SPHN|nr:helix-turn-helix domain-containing protein [Erythrobacter insulae]TRD10845.1 DUF4115 domain-containing protein [Erythrobacter insulae]